MKIAVTVTEPDLTAQVDPRFGRCTYFLFVDSETLKFEAVENPNVAAASGAGIQSAQIVANKGAEVLLTGNCGPNAFQTLQAAGVQVITGVTGDVKSAIESFKAGKFSAAPQSNVPPHFGMGGGMGRGMGMGRGIGMGRGMMSQQMPPTPGMPPGGGPASPSQGGPAFGGWGAMERPSKEEELQFLKQQAEFLKQQMAELNKRIKELEKKKDI